MVANIEELKTMDASENGKKMFPVANGRIKLLGGDQDLRTSTLIRDHPIRGKDQREFLGESEGSHPQPQDSLPDAGEAMNDFWSMSGRIIPHSKEAHTQIWMSCKEAASMILECHGSRDLSDFLDRFHSVYSIRRETSRRKKCGPGSD